MAGAYLSPKRLRTLSFSGTVTAAGAIIGPLGGTGVTLSIPGLLTTDQIIQWEIKNSLDSGASLDHKQGPNTAVFAAAVGAVLANYDVLSPGVSYTYMWRHQDQQVDNTNDQEDVLLVRAAVGTISFSGHVEFYRPEA